MPTCASCGRWDAPSAGSASCPSCGGVLGRSEARQHAEARAGAAAAALGLTVDEYQDRQQKAVLAAAKEHEAARVAEQATRVAQEPAIRAATRDRLIGEGMTQKTADNWMGAWEVQAVRLQLRSWDPTYWDAGWEWIVAGRALRPQPVWWDHEKPFDDDGLPTCLVVTIALILTGLLGVILLFVFLLLGLPAWIPIVGTVVGVLGGFFLGLAIDQLLFRALDRIAYRSAWVDRHAEDVLWFTVFVLPGIGPPVLMVATLLVLLRAVT